MTINKPYPDPATLKEAFSAPAPQITSQHLGNRLGNWMAASLDLRGKVVLVVVSAEDADQLAGGFIDVLSEAGAEVRLACLWMDRKKLAIPETVSVANIVQVFMDPLPSRVDHLVVLEGIVSDPCVVVTSLLRMLDETKPGCIHVAAPIALRGAAEQIEAELAASFVASVEFWALDANAQPSDWNQGAAEGETGSIMPELVRRRLVRRSDPAA